MTTENVHEESMYDMMQEIEKSMKRISVGDMVKGTVLSINNSEVLVNIGFMTDGLITREELSYDEETDPRDIVKVGDEINVYILQINDGEGNVALSKRKADDEQVWLDLEKSYNNHGTIIVKVKEVVKGGVTADYKGVRCFIPASQLAASYVENLIDYIGRELEVKVIELDEEKNKVVVSRREIEKVEVENKKERLWDSLKKGEKRKGTVTRLAKFGAFVDLGGMDGLIHVSDMSWKRVLNPEEIVSVGQQVEVYVLDFDKVKGRISLGLKEVSENPWLAAITKYKAGETVEGTIVKLMDFGAFVELEAGVEGLVHTSQISEERITKPAAVLNLGDKVKVKILEINEKTQKISLSIKDAVQKPEEDYSQYSTKEEASYSIGDLFKDKLKNFKFEE